MKPSVVLFGAILIIFILTGFSYASDIYEPDDNYSDASKIIVNEGAWQKHTLHIDSDEDWIKFFGLHNEKENKPTQYTIELKNRECNSDMTLELFKNSSFETPFFTKNNISQNEIVTVDLTCTKPTLYFIRVSLTGLCCAYCAYDIKVYRPYGEHNVTIHGKATRSGDDSKPAANIKVTTNIGCGDITDDEGNFVFLLPPESFVLKVDETNFLKYRSFYEAQEIGSEITNNISLIPINLGEGLLPILKMLTGIEYPKIIDEKSDLNNDGKIGLEEAIFILQHVAK